MPPRAGKWNELSYRTFRAPSLTHWSSDVNAWTSTLEGCDLGGVSVQTTIDIVHGVAQKAEQEELIHRYGLTQSFANRPSRQLDQRSCESENSSIPTQAEER